MLMVSFKKRRNANGGNEERLQGNPRSESSMASRHVSPSPRDVPPSPSPPPRFTTIPAATPSLPPLLTPSAAATPSASLVPPPSRSLFRVGVPSWSAGARRARTPPILAVSIVPSAMLFFPPLTRPARRFLWWAVGRCWPWH
jgi:hypothetical protein